MDISRCNRRLIALEEAAKLNEQKFNVLEQNLAAKEEQIVQLRAGFEPIAKDMKDYVRELKTQWDKKQDYFVKKLKRSALRTIKVEHEIEEKNIKLTKQLQSIKGQWKYFSQSATETEKNHFQSLRLGQELANKKLDQKIASLEETLRNEVVEFKNSVCMETQKELDKLKCEQEFEWKKVTSKVETSENKQKIELTKIRNEYEMKLISAVKQAKVLDKATWLRKEDNVVSRVKDHGRVYARRGLRCKVNFRRRHRRLYKFPMINNSRKHYNQSLKVKNCPSHRVTSREERRLEKKAQLKEEEQLDSHSCLTKDNHAYQAQVRNKTNSSDQSLVNGVSINLLEAQSIRPIQAQSTKLVELQSIHCSDTQSSRLIEAQSIKQVKVQNTRGEYKIGSQSQFCKDKSYGFFAKQQVPFDEKESLSVVRKPINVGGEENNPYKFLIKNTKGKHWFKEMPLGFLTDARSRPKYHRRIQFLPEMKFDVNFVVRWKDYVTVVLERRISSLMGIRGIKA